MDDRWWVGGVGVGREGMRLWGRMARGRVAGAGRSAQAADRLGGGSFVQLVPEEWKNVVAPHLSLFSHSSLHAWAEEPACTAF